ncbi:LAME_0C08900g1_1 [Lachancea meyersii CBS 8951]|uniref:Restriction of telomere capping protein 1 n=1 Tax=Lachancea meyersii CBS 8951 TaxID=1266667 RepID=A0A1G4J3I4_9SACH|nr:LAME_0C08900g1_1 [Lachancea meyersii CBS 8951]
MDRSRSPSAKDVSSSSGSRLPSSLSRFSNSSKQYHQLSGSDFLQGMSPKTSFQPRYPVGGFPPSAESVKETPSSSSGITNRRAYVNPGQIRSSGLKYSLQVPKELSSIDKINDPQKKSVVIAGKNHLGLYDFNSNTEEIRCVHDYLQNNSDTSSNSMRAFKKISTISDVKAGFHNHKNYVAICGTSNSVSIYDVNKASSSSGPLATVLSKHTRSINSVDFNMSQSNLIISGGQDGCVKVWDLRSSRGHKNMSDITINSGSDSVRDVKWMPTFDTISYDSPSGIANRGHKFASIHDSGLLLTYDIRQPSQAEKRINAHSGPGLCLSWHPFHEYIMTGGRDGKCCLWNVGLRNHNFIGNGNVHHNNSFSSASTLLAPTHPGNTTLIAPEVIINTAHPLTKLKFQPSTVENVFNSVVALSSLGENSDVSLYSLSRQYIPKNVLTTTTPSCGFVWWDENFIFNIDKQNMLTGWDLKREPTVLENLSKSVIDWRDIEGDGMLFISQDKGGYELNQKIANESQADHRSISQSKTSTTSVHNLFSGNSLRHNASSSSFPALASHHGSGVTFAERPSHPRSGTSNTFKSLHGQPIGSYNSQSNQHHNSIASMSTSSTAMDTDPDYISPKLISLDLPRLLNRIISSRTQSSVNRSNVADISALKESPVEVFKFLARELKFSYVQETQNARDDKLNATASNENFAQSEDDIDIKIHLINQFGLTEDNTWTKFIKDPQRQDTTDIENSFRSNAKDVSISSLRSNESSQSGLDKADPSTQQKEQSLVEDGRAAQAKRKIEHFIELISMCDHNAETYLFVEDLSNFKIWMMMRDALLWDLKQVADKFKLEALGSLPEAVKQSFVPGTYAVRRPSEASEYSSFSASEIASTPLPNSFPKHRDSLAQDTFSRPTSSSNLRAQSACNVGGDRMLSSSSRRATPERSSLKTGLEELRRRQSTHPENNDSAIEEEDELQPEGEHQSHASEVFQEHGIPIANKAGRKISFIDSFITNLRSPKGSHHDRDRDRDSEFNRGTHSLGSKKSGQPSYSSSFVSPGPGKHVDRPLRYHPSSTASLDEMPRLPHRGSLELDDLLGIDLDKSPNVNTGAQESKISQMLKCYKKYETVPPWDSAKLIKMFFKESVESGNVLLTITIILLFQTTFNVTSTLVVKDALAEFLNLLQKYELFETAADLLKYCPWDDILGSGTGQCTIRIYCERCKKLLVNERSKENFMEERKRTGNPDVMKKFGYWYCDACSRRNTLCVICERPLKKLALGVLNCGHMGHFECLQNWFMQEEMDTCPCGCPGKLI